MTNPTQPRGKLLIYGAAGYTGRLIAHRAQEAGLDFAIAGREVQAIPALAQELGVESHVFAVDDAAGWQQALAGKTCLLNVAGPFSATAAQAMAACLLHQVHYLDITAEVDIYRLAESQHEAALAAGVMVLSGAGLFVSFDPLALHTARRVPNPVRLRLAFKYSGGFTPGSVASSANIVKAGILVRRNSELIQLPSAPAQPFDFGDGPEDCLPTPLGGVVLGWKSTGIPAIEEYFQMALPAADSATISAAPEAMDTPSAAVPARSKLLAEVTDADGTVVRSMLDTPPGYEMTIFSAVAVAQRVLRGDFKPGYQSPASAYGEAMLAELPGVHLLDL